MQAQGHTVAEAAFRSIREAAAEAVTDDELRALCAKAAAGGKPRAYIGFEPSGTAHIGWMVCTDMVRRLTAAGFDVRILLADWHAQINDKLGGDLAAIQRCGRYMEEAFESLGVPRSSVTYVYANDFAKDPAYWAMVVKVAKNSTLARVRRAMTIMGRSEDEGESDMSKFLYPAMQVADIFHMGIDLAYGGMDQRHAHMLARDVAPKLGRAPPAAIHTPLVPGLKPGEGRMGGEIEGAIWVAFLLKHYPGSRRGTAREPDVMLADGTSIEIKSNLNPRLLAETREKFGPQTRIVSFADLEAQFGKIKPVASEQDQIDNKMSKSDPDSGIFIHDSPDDIKRKLKGAHCPAKEVDGNPVLDLLRLVVWPRLAQLHKDGPARFEIHRPEKFGGNKLYVGYDALLAEYRSGALHPMDLKNGVADALIALLQPVRDYFAKHPENWQFVQGLRKTR